MSTALRIGGGGDDRGGASQLTGRIGGVGLLHVDVVVCAERADFVGEIGAATDGDDPVAHVARVLQRLVAQAADPVDGHQVTDLGATFFRASNESMSAASAPQTPQAFTLIRTSPLPGCGKGRSTSSRTPGALTCIAR